MSNADNSVPHLCLSRDLKIERVVVCGCPERAEKITSLLKNPKALQKNREYHSFSGSFEGKEILVVSHGVGSAGAAICFNELIQIGAKIIIRVGTAGAFADGLKIGDIVVPTSAARLDGVSQLMVPLNFPASPDFDLTNKLISNLKASFHDIATGTIVTSDLYYPGLLDNGFELYKKAGAIAVEMECSTLFICGQLNQIKTSSVLGIDGNPLKWKEGNFDPRSSALGDALIKAAEAAIKTLVSC